MSAHPSSSLPPSTFHLPPPPSPKRILVIGLSNIGDAVLMSPVIERLHAGCPQAHLTLLVGERARALFANDPRVQRLVCMEEFEGVVGRLRLVRWVWQTAPDLLVDLRQTALPLVWRPWKAWRYLWPVPSHVAHMRTRHLWRLRRQMPHLHPALSRKGGVHVADGEGGQPIWLPQEAVAAVDQLLRRWGVDEHQRLIVIAPGARSHIKRWYPDRFAAVADRLIEDAHVEVVLTGEPDEAPVIQEVLRAMRHRAHNGIGQTTIQQLAALMRRARLVMTNDSAALHLACAVNTPVLALFGPTAARKYGPTGARDQVIQRRLFCAPCEQATCRFNHECMRFISADEVYTAARKLLECGVRNSECGVVQNQ